MSLQSSYYKRKQILFLSVRLPAIVDFYGSIVFCQEVSSEKFWTWLKNIHLETNVKFFGHHVQLKCAPSLCKNTRPASDFTKNTSLYSKSTFERAEWKGILKQKCLESSLLFTQNHQ